MRFWRLLFLAFLLSAVGSATGAAADPVKIRSASHDDYSRLVFEWPDAATYSLTKDGNRVILRFSKAASADRSGIDTERNIGKINILSKEGEPFQAAVTIPEGSRFRDFTVGTKTILDIYDPPGVKKASEKELPVKEAGKEKPSDVKTAEEKPAKDPKTQEAFSSKKAEEKPGFSKKEGEKAAAAPVQQIEAAKVPAPAFDPHVITLTTISSIGLAVFERNGWLWIVADDPELSVAPELAGPQKDRLPPLEKVNIQNVVAYRFDLPEGMKAYGEGGGLTWKIELSQSPKKTGPVPATAKDSALVWPLKDMRREIRFEDPEVGDTIAAIPASSASQYTGAQAEYVDLRTLPSIIGMVYVPKTDDVELKITPSEVAIVKPGGLALSSADEIQPLKIRKAAEEAPVLAETVEEPPTAETEEPVPEEEKTKPDETALRKPSEEAASAPEAPKTEEKKASPEESVKPADKSPSPEKEEPPKPEEAQVKSEEIARIAEEKPPGNDIYNFKRWEMGGIPALERNQHVMMVEVAAKAPEKRTEDLITMAKLMIANNRAQEALGLLRIVIQKVPELEENVQFASLRGAAYALAGKYDAAIEDLSREPLKSYNDIPYWRAYTLAGLEDWKQAIDNLPLAVTPIASYPSEIRTPLLLTYAEIALRGGKVPLAESFLGALKADVEKLPLAYASAWKYLQGELARQKGDTKKAMEYWEPLVRNGKDDLYRAKAGLSLTKLQLDTKKIKPAEAIDRLETLRYAWRGDELETLVNYRLGQIYIDNKDYLKGLTVLRNAVSLSPGSELSGAAQDYMTRSFRDIFANNRLDKMSPLEAISLYEEFKDLTPPGDEGDRYVEKLAERLVNADLLGRAASLLEYQVNNRLKGDRKAEIAIRLAAIRLLDGNPDGALRSLEIAQDTLDRIAGKVPQTQEPAQPTSASVKPEDVKPEAGEGAKTADAAKPEPPAETKPETVDPEKQRQVYLLKARALSMKNKPDEALAILEEMPLDPDVNRLRTDIAWKAGKWEEAARALNDLIIAEDISPSNPLTDHQQGLILNRAIALNLSGNRVALANLRERYNGQMAGTTKGKMFEVVSRSRKPDMIGSREAIESMISEIDLFKGFLDSYAKIDAKEEPKKEAPEAPAASNKEEKPEAALPEKEKFAASKKGDKSK
jgi:tetratricopeptide (TPR) repeat protein